MLKTVERPPISKAKASSRSTAKTNAATEKSECRQSDKTKKAKTATLPEVESRSSLTEIPPKGAAKAKNKAPRAKSKTAEANVEDKEVGQPVKASAKEKQAAAKKAKAEELKARRKAKETEVKEARKAIQAKAAPTKKRGLSLEEKCCRFEQHLAKTEEILTLKELEKIGPTIGVIPQAVKDVITLLIKERRIKCEKVGASNIYWLFKRDLAESRLKERESLEKEIQNLRLALSSLEASACSVEEGSEYTLLSACEKRDLIVETREHLTELKHQLYNINRAKSIAPSGVKAASRILVRSWAEELDLGF